jgi:hypothetical protein
MVLILHRPLPTLGLTGLGVIVALWLTAQCVAATASDMPTIRPVSDPQMAGVLASTRHASLAAAKLVGVGTAGSPVTMQVFDDIDDIAVIDASVLETPLDGAEQDAARDTIAAQYRENPQGFTKSVEVEHKLAQVLLSGSATEQMQARTVAWIGWLSAAQKSPHAAHWVATVRRHNSPVASIGGIVVTNRQLDALFVSNDWAARAANLPPSTPESRAAFAQALPRRFNAISQTERQQLALADLRWYALRAAINFGLQSKAVEIVHQNVHGPGDIAPAARYLEDSAIDFEQGMAQFNKQMWSRTLAIMGGVGEGAVAQSINQAQNRFEGKFDATPHH